MKKIISFMIALTLFITTFTFNVNAAELNSKGFIGYMEGVPITKDDINENGRIINKDKLELIAQYSEPLTSDNILDSKFSLKSRSKHTLTVVYGKNVYVTRIMTAPSYSQTTNEYYLTPVAGRNFASKITVGTKETVASYIVSLIKVPYGTIIGAAALIKGLHTSAIASDIRDYADYDKPVSIKVSTSPYGTFYGVFSWDGKHVDLTDYYPSQGNKDTVKNYYYN